MDGYVRLHQGKFCSIWAHPNAIKEVKNATAEDRAKVQNYLKEFAANGHENLNEQQFKYEGRYPSKGAKSTSIPVYAAKGTQLRVYCGLLENEGKQLLCVEAAKKQQNKADLAQLKRVAKKIGEIKDGNE